MNPPQTKSRAVQVVGLVVSIALVFLVAWVGANITTPQIPNWYANLEKPSFNPPSWVFGPTWTLLYLMMATAAWLVWRKEGFAGAKLALGVYGVQLFLNGLWSPLFFGWQRPDLALINIVLMWFAILATILLFWRHHRVAASLLVPYLLWVSFATVLNASIWWMN